MNVFQSTEKLVELSKIKHPEAPTPSHDCFIWPLPRFSMRNANLIQQRMLSDFHSLAHFDGEDNLVCEADLIAVGWSRTQVTAHAPKTNELYRQELDTKSLDKQTSNFNHNQARST
jgi:hypothetical protein